MAARAARRAAAAAAAGRTDLVGVDGRTSGGRTNDRERAAGIGKGVRGACGDLNGSGKAAGMRAVGRAADGRRRRDEGRAHSIQKKKN